MNAANEEAVAAFLADRIRFTRIFDLVGEALSRHTVRAMDRLETVLEADRWAREQVRKAVNS